MSGDILIVDDEDDIRALIQGILSDEGYDTRMAASSKQAYEEIERRAPALIILDIWLQGSDQDGLEILKRVKRNHPHLPIIMISGHGTIETAVSSIKEGAYDFIEKPFKSDRLLLMMQRALETAALRRENETLKQKTQKRDLQLVGHSAATEQLRRVLERVAQTNSRVLLSGAPGSGKDVAARTLYKLSDRADKPFLVLNCATLRPERLEIELFGATANIDGTAKVGLLEQADGGTLFLDEVSDMPLETQGKIVRTLQDQKFQKIGHDKFTETDVRILASTNRDLAKEIEEGNFREDLYYRLNVVPVQVPTLKARADDIPDLVAHFVNEFHEESGLPLQEFSKDAFQVMKAYDWPGNVRQLRNVVESALIMNAGQSEKAIGPEGLPPEINKGNAPFVASEGHGINPNLMALPLKEARDLFELEYLEEQVKRFEGNISKTAQFVGMERSALHRKIKTLQTKEGGGENKEQESSRKRA